MASLSARLKNPWILLIFAFLLAGLVAYVAYLYLQQREQRIKEEVTARSSKKQAPKVSVVVPREDARIGVVIEQGLFVSREIDQDLAYPDTVLSSDFQRVRGQRLARPVLHGRPLRITDLQAPEINDVAAVLPNGRRALTIEIDNLNSFAQTLRPGHRVDVFLLSKLPRSKDVDVPEAALNQATLFMQNLSVLATGQEFQDIASSDMERTKKMVRPGEVQGAREKGFDTVTVLVTPAEAARLLVGQKLGSYRVALRGNQDSEPVSMGPLTGAELGPTAGKSTVGIEYIVGGKSGGSAALPSTLVPVLPGGLAAATAATAGPTSPNTADIKRAVEQAMREVGTPRRLANTNREAAEAAARP